MKTNVKPAEGKLGILVVGCGAVATTLMTGVLMARRGLAKPIGSMTQYDKIRIGKGKAKRYLSYADIVPMASVDDIVFGCWDVYPQNAYQSAVYAKVLKREDIEPVREELERIVPMKAAFDRNYAKRLDGDNVKDCKTRWEMVEMLREDIRSFRAHTGCQRIVVLWAASTEIYVPIDKEVHYSLEALEAAMQGDDRQHIAPSMCYAYAALSEGCPFIMGAPNTAVDIPAMWQLAEKMQMPICGKDFKTGQTLVKSGFAPYLAPTASDSADGSLPTSSAIVTDWCLTNRRTSARRRCRSCQCLKPFSSLASSPTFTGMATRMTRSITIRYASTTTHRATTTRSRGTTSTSSAG